MAKTKQKQETKIKQQLHIENKRGPQWTGLSPKIEKTERQKAKSRQSIKRDTRKQAQEYYKENRREGYTKLRKESSQSNDFEF